jgi:hypothetical protein
MSIYYDLILRSDGSGRWALYTLKGIKFYEVRAHTLSKAIEECNAYMSTWTSVRIRVEEEYEQEKQRDNVSSSSSGDDSTT